MYFPVLQLPSQNINIPILSKYVTHTNVTSNAFLNLVHCLMFFTCDFARRWPKAAISGKCVNKWLKYNKIRVVLAVLFVLFSWRYNPLCLHFHSPVTGFSLLVFENSLITHNDAPQSVGLLWTSDQSVAETSNWQYYFLFFKTL